MINTFLRLFSRGDLKSRQITLGEIDTSPTGELQDAASAPLARMANGRGTGRLGR